MGTGVDVLLVYGLVIVLHFPLYLGTTIAFVVAASHNFVLNKLWTFHDRGWRYKRQYVKFLFVSCIGLGITLFIMALLIEVWGIQIILSKLITSIIVLAWNFLANKYWTFGKKLEIVYEQSTKKYPLMLSIIIPAYNEEKRIAHTLDSILEWKKSFSYENSIEIIVVNDGSTDDTSIIVRNNFSNIRVIELPENNWKGFAVAQWVMQAEWEFGLIMDADNSTPISELDKLFPFLQQYDIVIGSRYTRNSMITEKQGLFRRLVSRIGNILIQSVLIDGIEDTQCGFKLFHTDKAKVIFQKQRIHRWGFDIEMLFLAKAFWFKILEIWVEWKNNTNSRFRAIRDSLRTFYELVSIKFFAWFWGYK